MKITKTMLNLNDLELLELCANIEMKCAEFYRFLSVQHASFPELSGLWSKTADEELNHAEQFKLAIRIRGANMRAVKADVAKIHNILEQLDSFLSDYKESKPTPVQGLVFAIKLEENLAEYHMDTLVDFTDIYMKNLFSAMAKNDRGHIDMLHMALKELSEAT